MSYVIVSDLHCHKWSTFSNFTANGVNGRLHIILDELTRAAHHAKRIGATFIVCAGDIQHVRGSLDPEVLNPLQQRIQEIVDMGIDILAIPGNHDLAGKDTTELGSGIQTLTHTRNGDFGFRVFNEASVREEGDHLLGFVPYRASRQLLLDDLAELAKHPNKDQMDVFIHAGIDGVLIGVPDHGLTGEMLADFGFRQVFAGDYHSHKEVYPTIWSIGATTHQRWNDVGTKAGFMSVDDDGKPSFHATHAPRFVDVSGMSEEDMALTVDGNYARFSGPEMTSAEMAELRKFLEDSGAQGVIIMAPKKSNATARSVSINPAGTVTLDQSVSNYVDAAKDIPAHIDRHAVKVGAADVLKEARSLEAA